MTWGPASLGGGASEKRVDVRKRKKGGCLQEKKGWMAVLYERRKEKKSMIQNKRDQKNDLHSPKKEQISESEPKLLLLK